MLNPERRTALRWLSTMIGLAFVALAAAVGYWGLVRSAELVARPDNARRALLERRYPRGLIVDRNGQVLAESIRVGDGYARTYPYPTLGPVLGYSSALYGAAGIEAAGDAFLHGDASQSELEHVRGLVLGEPPQPGALQLTLDLDLQRRVDTALGARPGAAVVLDLATGDVLALASHPSFDPNQLDERWADLTADPGSPLLNRASTALYQPGAALYPALYALGLQTGLIDPDADAPGSSRTVTIGTVKVGCAAPADLPITWELAVQLRCPAPFVSLANALEPQRVAQLWRDLGLFEAPALGLPTSAALDTDSQTEPAALLGQGTLTMTPLHYARIVAAWAREGTVPAPRLILAERAASGSWIERSPVGSLVSAFSPASTAPLKALVTRGYSAAAVAGTGPDQRELAWYGLATPANDPRVAVVVLLEGGADGEAEAIGREIAAAASR